MNTGGSPAAISGCPLYIPSEGSCDQSSGLPRNACLVRSGAFTLIELLVVIAIISLLASLLMPALATARRRALATVCLSRLKACGQGLFSYLIDHDGFLPPNQTEAWTGNNPQYARTAAWSVMLHYRNDYLSQPDVCACPAQLREQGGRYYFNASPNHQWAAGYGSWLRDWSYRLDSLPERFPAWPTSPSRQVLLIDSVQRGTMWDWQTFAAAARQHYTGVHCRHDGRAQVLFADWSAGGLTKQALLDRPDNQWSYGVFLAPPLPEYIYED